jgi:hypothetical protein
MMIQPPDNNGIGGHYNNKSRRGDSYRGFHHQQHQQPPSIENFEMYSAALEQQHLQQPYTHSVDVDEDDVHDQMINNDDNYGDDDDDDINASMDHNNAMNPEDMY